MFYGWWVVAAAALGMLLGAAPIVVFSFSVYFKPLSEEFHASRGSISLAFTAFNLTQALSAPLVGRLVDRVGARAVILAGTALLGLVLVCAKLLGAGIAGMYILLSPAGTNGGMRGISLRRDDFALVQSKRGLALGLMMLGTGVGAMLAPPVAHRLIAMFGRRTSYALCGCAVLVIALPVAFILLRGDPRDKGLLPDGLPLEETTQPITTSARGGDEGLSWHETWHKSDFWLLIGSFFLASASVHACILDMSALLTDRGVTAQGAAVAGSVSWLLPAGGCAGSLFNGGWLRCISFVHGAAG